MPKRIVVTGGTGNLGAPVVERLKKEGYELIVVRRPEGDGPSRLEKNEVDLASETEVKDLVTVWKRKYDRIDGLVCMAGGFAMSDLSATGESELLDMYKLNFLTTFFLASTLYPWMKDQGGGQMIFTGAKAPLEGGGSAMIPYALSKSSVIELAKLINETGIKDRVTASVIAPSTIDTPVNRESMPDADFEKWVKPEVIAEHITFLLSDSAAVLRNPILKVYNKS